MVFCFHAYRILHDFKVDLGYHLFDFGGLAECPRIATENFLKKSYYTYFRSSIQIISINSLSVIIWLLLPSLSFANLKGTYIYIYIYTLTTKTPLVRELVVVGSRFSTHHHHWSLLKLCIGNRSEPKVQGKLVHIRSVEVTDVPIWNKDRFFFRILYSLFLKWSFGTNDWAP